MNKKKLILILSVDFLLHLRDEVIGGEYGQILVVNCSRTTIEGKTLRKG